MEKGQTEYQILKKYSSVVGVDEVGRGCLAGPVYAAAVILDYSKLPGLPGQQRDKIRDSKTLSHKQRQEVLPVIEELAVDYAVAWSTARQIEELGIVHATSLAMINAIGALQEPHQFLLIDGHRPLKEYPGPQQYVVKGDQLCYCIAAASVLAKEARDQYMREQAVEFPGYGFENHVGYGTRKHMEALESLGVCSLHRRNFAPVMRHL